MGCAERPKFIPEKAVCGSRNKRYCFKKRILPPARYASRKNQEIYDPKIYRVVERPDRGEFRELIRDGDRFPDKRRDKKGEWRKSDTKNKHSKPHK